MTYKTILTKAAKDAIRAFLLTAAQRDDNEWNPTRMLPSPDPNDYSYVSGFLLISNCQILIFFDQWCTICRDRNADLLLCAGCRSGLCARSVDDPRSATGCLEYDPATLDPKFIFHCPICSQRRGQVMQVSGRTFDSEPWLKQPSQ